MTHIVRVVVAAIAACLAMPLHAEETPLAFIHATIYPVASAPIEDGTLLVQNGKILAVGSSATVRIPGDAKSIDLAGRVIVPGLVDTHSHIGNYSRPAVPANADGNESTDPVTPHIRALDAIWPADPGIRMAQAGGVTTANIMPGSGNVIGGQTAYVKLRGSTIDEMLIDGSIGGLKMANGENPKRNYGSRDLAPQTRMAVAALARQAYFDARNYKEQRGGDEPPKNDLGMEARVEVHEGKSVVQHHTHRADDILTVLRIAD